MATTRKPAKKAPGRPRKAPEEKLEQFSIRLPPKLKFGLELLSRGQHRSLSQAVEWALQMGMNTYEVGPNSQTLTDLVTEAWRHPDEARRLLEIYWVAPTLLSFEDAAVCELVGRSIDGLRLEEQLEKEFLDDKKFQQLSMIERADKVGAAGDAIYWPVILAYWDELKEIAVERANNGQSLRLQILAELLYFYSLPEEESRRYEGLLEAYRRQFRKLNKDD